MYINSTQITLEKCLKLKSYLKSLHLPGYLFADQFCTSLSCCTSQTYWDLYKLQLKREN